MGETDDKEISKQMHSVFHQEKGSNCWDLGTCIRNGPLPGLCAGTKYSGFTVEEEILFDRGREICGRIRASGETEAGSEEVLAR